MKTGEFYACQQDPTKIPPKLHEIGEYDGISIACSLVPLLLDVAPKDVAAFSKAFWP